MNMINNCYGKIYIAVVILFGIIIFALAIYSYSTGYNKGGNILLLYLGVYVLIIFIILILKKINMNSKLKIKSKFDSDLLIPHDNNYINDMHNY
jgi:hypothetical protein